jgi:hypothetical protein
MKTNATTHQAAQHCAPAVPASYFVHRGAALFRHAGAWRSAPVDAGGRIDWAEAEDLAMPDLFVVSEVLESRSIAMAIADQI